MIYKNIKRIADSKGLSIYRIERESGIGNGTIAKWGKIADQKPTVGNLKKVADFLEVSLEDLMQEENKKEAI